MREIAKSKASNLLPSKRRSKNTMKMLHVLLYKQPQYCLCVSYAVMGAGPIGVWGGGASQSTTSNNIILPFTVAGVIDEDEAARQLAHRHPADWCGITTCRQKFTSDCGSWLQVRRLNGQNTPSRPQCGQLLWNPLKWDFCVRVRGHFGAV